MRIKLQWEGNGARSDETVIELDIDDLDEKTQKEHLRFYAHQFMVDSLNLQWSWEIIKGECK